ncbi:heparanase-like protein 3 [Vigna radiata var. radiata]|uniref:Heparanase-like protein 3 n=1 Tax=Vigna radiata var. radiata TaxID=3916 RepID=A0A1S3VX57_VIGRR|nr:heparanase-like protein 3 [Vigna radiata var. radiata]
MPSQRGEFSRQGHQQSLPLRLHPEIPRQCQCPNPFPLLGMVRPTANGTDGDGHFDRSDRYDTVFPKGASSQVCKIGETESVFGQEEEEAKLWREEVSRMGVSSRAFSPLKDKLIYGTEDYHLPCTPFVKDASEMFGFTQGCLPLKRWDELNYFFKKSGAKIIFGLNALAGKTIHGNSATGPWNSTNAESFIRYNVRNGYTIHGWELRNELSGSGVGISIKTDQYASDFAALRDIVYNEYADIDSKPLVIAPRGFFDSTWFREFISKSGKALDVVTHHIYNLGPGVDEHLVERIQDPSFLDKEASTFSGLKNILASKGTSATAWVGESGGAYNRIWN